MPPPIVLISYAMITEYTTPPVYGGLFDDGDPLEQDMVFALKRRRGIQ